MNNVCPHCGYVRDRPYARKTKCKECGEQVFVRAEAVDILGRTTVKEREAALVHFWKCLQVLLNLRVEHFETQKTALESRWGKKVPASEVLWALRNNQELFLRTLKDKDYVSKEHMISEVHFKQEQLLRASADFMADYLNKDPSALLRSANKEKLLYIQQQDERHVKVREYTSCCTSCENYDDNDTFIDCDEEIENMRLPRKGCTNIKKGNKYATCTCTYTWF